MEDLLGAGISQRCDGVLSPWAATDRPLQDPDHQGPASSSSPLPQSLSWRSPCDSVHRRGRAPSAAPAPAERLRGTACPQSGSDTLISLSVLVLQKNDTKGEELQQTHLDLGKEMSEAAFWVDLKRRRQVQYELHDDGLVGHLLHQGVFLEMNKREQGLLPNVVLIVFHKVSLWSISLNPPPIKNNDCITL